MEAMGFSNIGLIRSRNEDTYLIKKEAGLFVVCDGMGGHKGGDVAARLAVEVIDRTIQNNQTGDTLKSLNQAIKLANRVILKQSKDNHNWNNMGTTITAAIINEKGLSIGHVGDSSLFVIRHNNIKKLTRDHTLAEKMVKEGLLEHEEVQNSSYSHVLTRAVGLDDNIKIDNYQAETCPGDYIIICSDGLTDMLNEEEILAPVLSANGNLEIAGNKLMTDALNKGGYDNITFILVRI